MGAAVRLYTDEHVPTAVAVGLRRRGIDVLTAQEAGMLGATDEEHLRLAAQMRRTVLTQDADFLRLHALGVPHAGIAFARQHTPIGRIVRGAHLICQVLDADDMLNHVEFL